MPNPAALAAGTTEHKTASFPSQMTEVNMMDQKRYDDVRPAAPDVIRTRSCVWPVALDATSASYESGIKTTVLLCVVLSGKALDPLPANLLN